MSSGWVRDFRLLIQKGFFSLFPTFLICAIVALVLYWPARHSGYVSDYTGLAEQLQVYSFSDIFRNNWDFHAFIPMAYIFYWSIFKIFGLKSLGWFLTAIILHAFNSSLLYSCIKKLDHLSSRKLNVVAIASTILFLISPFQAEVLVWKVCLHYLLCGVFMFGVLRLVLTNLAAPSNALVIVIFLAQLGALMSKEYAYMTPLIATIWIGAYYKFDLKFIARAKKIILVLWSTIPIYFILNKVYLNNWIGHDGAKAAMGGELIEFIPNVGKYISKYLLQTRFFFNAKEQLAIQDFFSENALLITALVGLCILAAFWQIIKKKSTIRVPSSIWFTSFCVALAPSIYLYMPYVLLGENDRYGYIASWFLFPMIFLWMRRLPIYLNGVFLFISVIIFTQLTVHINSKWQENAVVHYALLTDFRWYDRDYVFVLSAPNSYHGLYLFRSCDTHSTIEQEIEYTLRIPFDGKIIDVCQYNMVNLDHGGGLTPLDSSSYKFTYNQWGGWNWTCAKGTSNYENEYYSFRNAKNGFIIELKEIPENSVFIYQDSLSWKEAEMEY